MEEPTTPVIAKKLSNMVRLILFTLQKGVSKKKLTMMKRGKILGKSLNDFVLRHHTTLSCRSMHDVHVSFVYPLEYEFSCSSSPPRQTYAPCHVSGRRGHNNNYHLNKQQSRRAVYVPMMCENVLGSVNGIKKVSFCGGDVAEPSPIVRRVRIAAEPTPIVRRVRITEWEPLFPFSSDEEEEEEYHVDKAAQEFIDKFYRELMLQKWMAADVCPRVIM